MTHTHAIEDVRLAPGSLEYVADIAGTRRGVWFRVSEPVPPRGDALLPASLLPAMTAGGTLELPGRVSPRMLRGADEIQAVLAHWSRSWPLTQAPLLPVAVTTRAEPDWSVPPGARTGLFFRGGVDSFSVLLDRPDVTDLIFVAGLDVPLDDRERVAAVDAHLRRAAAELSLRYVRVDTNIRSLVDRLIPWRACHGSVLAAVASLLGGLLARVYVAGPASYAELEPNGSHPLIDHLWTPEGLELVHDGARHARTARIERIAGHPVVRRHLRVCWERRGAGELNCGRCEKCLLTMVPLAVLGVLDGFTTFPPLELERVATVSVSSPLAARFWQDDRAFARAHGAPRQLVAAIDSALAGVGR